MPFKDPKEIGSDVLNRTVEGKKRKKEKKLITFRENNWITSPFPILESVMPLLENRPTR